MHVTIFLLYVYRCVVESNGVPQALPSFTVLLKCIMHYSGSNEIKQKLPYWYIRSVSILGSLSWHENSNPPSY